MKNITIFFITIIILYFAYASIEDERPEKSKKSEDENEDIEVPEVEKPRDGKDPNDFYTNDELKQLPEVEILARTLYGEGRGIAEDEISRIGTVIMNRKNANGWKDTVKEVCLQPKQFSCWNLPRFGKLGGNAYETRKVEPREKIAYQTCFEIAKNILSGEYPEMPQVYHYFVYVPGDTIIYNDKIYSGGPSWARNAEVVWKGEHVFLRGVN
ncbi:MAG: cell wall hydrolase [Candidatus Woesearchaeota archaeon]